LVFCILVGVSDDCHRRCSRDDKIYVGIS
jgi:hypothetical protein